jgi:glycosyltransferase involved in cell wall biosynthesis
LKILVVSSSFYPQKSPRSFRTTELVKEFARQGHQVDVVLPQNLQEQIEASFDKSFLVNFHYYGPLLWKNLEKSKHRLIGDWKRKFGRLLFLLFEYPHIEILFKLPKLLKNMYGYDLLISNAVPHENHWSIARIRNRNHPIAGKWVADCGDPFMANVLEKISPPFYFAWLEKSFLKKADFVSVPTKDSIDAYDSSFKDKFIVIPQGFNFDEVLLCDAKPEYGVPTFAYAGGVSNTGIRSLHKVIELLKSSGKSFCFHIYSPNGKTVLDNIVKGWEKSIILHEAIPRTDLLYELSKMDFLVNLDNGTHLNTPSKLIDYGLAKRPILNINPIYPDKELLMSFINYDYEKAYVIENLNQYNIKEVANSFLSLVHKQ